MFRLPGCDNARSTTQHGQSHRISPENGWDNGRPCLVRTSGAVYTIPRKYAARTAFRVTLTIFDLYMQTDDCSPTLGVDVLSWVKTGPVCRGIPGTEDAL